MEEQQESNHYPVQQKEAAEDTELQAWSKPAERGYTIMDEEGACAGCTGNSDELISLRKEIAHAIMLKDKQIQELKERLLAAEIDRDRYHDDNLDYIAACKGMSAACAKSDEHIDKIEAEIEQWKRVVVTHVEEIERLRVENARLQADNKVMAALNDSFPAEIAKLEDENTRLSTRDGNATIQLLTPTNSNPWHKVNLRVVDFGVSDNIYVVESDNYAQLQEALTEIADSFRSVGEDAENMRLIAKEALEAK